MGSYHARHSKSKRCYFIFPSLIVLVLFVILFPTLFNRFRHQSNSISTSLTVSPTGIIFPTITPESFTPFPVPSDTPIPNTFPETQPQNPPAVSDSGKVVPDFGQAWKRAYSKAKARIASWSLEQKVNSTTGIGWSNGLCVGNIPPIKDWPGLCLEVRNIFPSCSYVADLYSIRTLLLEFASPISQLRFQLVSTPLQRKGPYYIKSEIY